MTLLTETINNIGELDQTAMAKAQERLDSLTKPPGSLGKLEEIAVTLAGITGTVYPEISKREVVLFAGDHGVVAEGVSAFPQDVTAAMVLNFLHGGAAVNVFARQVGAKINLVDIGMQATLDHPGLCRKKVRAGTNNFCQGPAMTHCEAVQALEVGISRAQEAQARGVNLLATGEMGIGNTTASSALAAVLGNMEVEEVVGRGTGIDDVILQKKIAVIKTGLAINAPNPDDALDCLAKVGGLEIAGLAGLILGAAAVRIPVIIDGFISSAAALVAYKLAPNAKNFMLASHASAEPGHQHVLKVIGIRPLIFLDMRLGEGTGAVLMMSVVETAARMIKEMATFAEAGIVSG